MGKLQTIRIKSSAFKHIASLDLFAASFIKDEVLFPSDAPQLDRRAMYEEFVVDFPYCSPFAISAGEALLVPFTKLHETTGSTSPLRKFLPVIDELVAKPLPEYFSVKMRGRKTSPSLALGNGVALHGQIFRT